MGLISRVSSRTYRWSDMQISSASNYYQVLGIKSSASETDAKKAFHKLARELHPDKQDSEQPDHVKTHTQELFKQVQKAYETLKDPKLRCQYDRDQKLQDIKLKEEATQNLEKKMREQQKYQENLQKSKVREDKLKQDRLKQQAKEQEKYLKKLEQRRAKARAHIQAKEEEKMEQQKYKEFLQSGSNMNPGFVKTNNH